MKISRKASDLGLNWVEVEKQSRVSNEWEEFFFGAVSTVYVLRGRMD